jgi:hypothetical protein
LPLVKRDTEIAKVPPLIRTLDVDLDDGLQRMSSRSPAEDWGVAAAKVLRSHRAGRQTVRLEWPDDDERRVIDYLAEPASVSPPWVDVVASADGQLQRLRLEVHDSDVVRTQYEVRDASGGLTTRAVRALGQTPLLRTIESILAGHRTREVLGDVWTRDVKRPGRAGRPDGFYADWASRYVAALNSPAGAIRALVDEEAAAGRPTTASAVRAYVNKARSRGLLSDAPAGKQGGALTSKGKKALRGRTS